jgi:hypothetical protein
MWLLPAVMVPLLVGWVVLQRMMVTRVLDDELAAGDPGEGHAGRAASSRPPPDDAIVLCTVAAVATFCGVLALIFRH